MTKAAHRPVSSLHRGRAKALRRDMTNAERRLWIALRGHRFQSLSFRRQAPIGAFIVDFVCHQCRLIIEIDGGQHATNPVHDIQRDAWLVSKGYRVLRFWNSDVLQNIEGVLEVILNTISSGLPPSLTLPLKGGGDKSPASLASELPSQSHLPNPPLQAGEGASRCKAQGYKNAQPGGGAA